MNLPLPWQALSCTEGPALQAELQRELGPTHCLYRISVTALAQMPDGKDVLYLLDDGSNRVAQVHLTWIGRTERDHWPSTVLFDNLEEWRRGKLKNGEDQR
jgi:hypothetical protein